MAVSINVFDDTEYLLQQWARWARSHNLGEYPSMTPFRRLSGGGIGAARITDEMAMQVDRAIAQLKKQEPLIGQLLSRYYLCNGNLSRVLEQFDFDRRAAMQMLSAGVAWIDATIGAERIELARLS